MNSMSGGCHCGQIKILFSSLKEARSLPIRSCTCQFCIKHAARYTSDPEGKLEITLTSPEKTIRYKFSLETAEFLNCGECGTYVAAVMTDSGKMYSVINVNCLDDVQALSSLATSHSWDHEDADTRRARRIKNWTPTLFR